jgi:hypothetical protein
MQGFRGSTLGCQQSASNLTSCSLAWLVRAGEVSTVYLRRRGEEVGSGRDWEPGAKSSHGRSHRFDPCHAHHTKLQVTPPECTPRCRSGTRRGSAGPQLPRRYGVKGRAVLRAVRWERGRALAFFRYVRLVRYGRVVWPCGEQHELPGHNDTFPSRPVGSRCSAPGPAETQSPISTASTSRHHRPPSPSTLLRLGTGQQLDSGRRLVVV